MVAMGWGFLGGMFIALAFLCMREEMRIEDMKQKARKS